MRESKFNKSRYVPLHDSTLEALAALRAPARRALPDIHATRASSCRCAEHGCYPCAVEATFRRLRQAAGVGANAPSAAEVPRPQAHLRRRAPWSAGIATASTSSRDCPALADLSGASRPRLHLLLPVGRAGAAGLCRRPARRRPGGAVMTAGRPDPAGVLQRPPGQAAAREPAHDRLLPRHAEPAAALRAGHDRQSAVSAGVGRTRRAGDRRVPRAPRDRRGTTARGRGTSGSPRSDPCSRYAAAPPSRARRRDRDGCSASRPNASNDARDLPHRRRGPSVDRRSTAGIAGKAAATTRC